MIKKVFFFVLASSFLFFVNVSAAKKVKKINAVPICKFNVGNRVNAVAYCPSTKVIAYSLGDGIIQYFQVRFRSDKESNEEPLIAFDAYGNKEVAVLCFSLDGKFLASLSNGSSFKYWMKKESGICSVGDDKIGCAGICVYANGYPYPLYSSTSILAGAGSLVGLQLGSPKTETYSADYNWHLSVGFAGLVAVIRPPDTLFEEPLFVPLLIIKAHDDEIYAVAFSPSNKEFVTCSADKTIKLWDVESLKCLGVITGHATAVTAVAFSSCGKWLISGSEDGIIFVWKLNGEIELDEYCCEKVNNLKALSHQRIDEVCEAFKEKILKD